MPVYALYYKRKEGICQMKNSLDYEINQDYRCGYNAGFADGRAAAWIPVADATPDAGQKVMVYISAFSGGLVDTATFRGGVFTGSHWHCEQEQITHWMPLPEEPEAEQSTEKDVACGRQAAQRADGEDPSPAGGKPGRTATVEWYTPAEKLPDTEVLVMAVVNAESERVAMVDSMELAYVDADGVWMLEDYPGIKINKVSWWCEPPCVPDAEDTGDE